LIFVIDTIIQNSKIKIAEIFFQTPAFYILEQVLHKIVKKGFAVHFEDEDH
jgi:hypothetical protein